METLRDAVLNRLETLRDAVLSLPHRAAIRNAHPGALHRDRCTTRIQSLSNFTVVGNTVRCYPTTPHRGINLLVFCLSWCDFAQTAMLWVPYARWAAGLVAPAEQELVVVVANNDNSSAVTVSPALSATFLAEVFGGAAAEAGVRIFTVTDLWNGRQTKTMDGSALLALELDVKADLTAGGGLAVLAVRALG